MGARLMAMRLMFLQGHPSAFARDLGRALAARGHAVRRVNLCFGDWLFWHGPDCESYRGSLADWEGWIEARMRAQGTTHLIYFADRHPYHVAAQRAARRLGVVCVSHEFGYLRPDWILVEEGGQSAFSHFPDDLALLKRQAAGLPDPDMTRRFSHPFWQEAVQEMAYHLGNAFLWPLYPGFRSDRVDHPVVEYLSYLPRHLAAARAAGPARRLVAELARGTQPFHLVALQMAGDYQIRANSGFADPRAFLETVIRSHAAHAAPDAMLVVKLHPMDNGRVPWARLTRQMAVAAGHGDRVRFLDGGDLGALLSRAAGCVVVNSTVGLHALQAGCPVKCLGIATYDMTGLTHQGSLDAFWRRPERPDPEGVSALIRLMASVLHVRGDFFSPEGRRAGVSGFVELLEGGLARRAGAFVTPPPRLGRARDMGLAVAPWDEGPSGRALLDPAPGPQSDCSARLSPLSRGKKNQRAERTDV